MKYIIIAMLVLFSLGVHAQSGAQTEVVKTDTLTETTSGNANAEGGNVSMMNLTSTQSTSRWQGFYGNVTGTLALGLGTDIFYDFTSATELAVYASRNQSFDFTSIGASLATSVDTAWGYGSGPDQAEDIFVDTTTIEGIAAPSVELEPIGNNFNSTILDDGAPTNKLNFVFGTNVMPAAACFDGTNCEYELMVPSDGQEVYYFFVSI